MDRYSVALFALGATILLVAVGISIAITMGLVYGVCWCFGWSYSHKLALGVWFLSALIGGAVRSSGKHD